MVSISKNQIHLRRERKKAIQSDRVPPEPFALLLHGVQRLRSVRTANTRRRLQLRPQQNDNGHTQIHRAVHRASHGAILRLSSLLRAPVVPRRVLVLQRVHSVHASLVRVHSSAATAPKHAANSTNGQQDVQDHGVPNAEMGADKQR
jgi:hypothetical protein